MIETSRPAEFVQAMRWGINEAFAKLWLARTVSAAGSAVTTLALSLTAARSLAATPAQMGLLVAWERAPVLVFSLLVGVWVDRTSARKLLVRSEFVRGVLMLVIPAAALAGSLSMALLYGLVFCTGTLALLSEVSGTTLLPKLVPKSALAAGNGRISDRPSSWGMQ